MAFIADLLGLYAYGTAVARYRPRHWVSAALVPTVAVGFFCLLAKSLNHAERLAGPGHEQIETTAPR